MRLPLFHFAILSLLLGLWSGAHAQETGAPATVFPPLAELEAKVKSLGADGDTVGEREYQGLVELRGQIDFAESEAADFRRRLQAAADELSRAKRGLEELDTQMASQAEADVAAAEGASLRDLRATAKMRKAEQEVANARKSALEEEESRRDERLDEIPKLIAAKGAELKDLEAVIGSSRGTQIEKLTRLGKRLLLENTLDSLKAERDYYIAQEVGELLRVEQDLALRETDARGRRAAVAQQRVDTLRAKMAKQKAEEAAAAAAELAENPDLPAALARYAEINVRMAEARIGPDGLAAKIDQANDELARAKSLLERIERDHADATEQVELIESAGLRLPEITGNLLRREKSKLPGVSELQGQIRSGLALLTDLRVEKARMENTRRDEVADLEGAVTALVGAEDGSGRDLARTLVRARRDLYEKLIPESAVYENALNETVEVRRQLIARVRSYSDFIEQRVFWIRSEPPLHESEFDRVIPSAHQLVTSVEWGSFAGMLAKDMGRQPLLWLAVAGALIYLLRRRHELKKRLAAAGDIAAKRNCRTYEPTLKALFYTCLIAAPIPLAVGFICWRASEMAVPGTWPAVVGDALHAIFFPAAALAIARGICKSRGLVQCHLGMGAAKVELLYRGFTWAMLLYIPLVFVREVLFSLDFNSAGRVVYIFSNLVIAAFAYKVLRPSVGLMASTKKTLWQGFAYPVYLLILGLSLGMAIAIYLGYSYTVTELAWRVRLSVWVVLMVILVASVLMRFLVVSRRRVAFEQRLAAFRAAQAEREHAGSGDKDPEAPNVAEIEAELVDITRVKEQTQSIIRMSALVVVVVSLWGTWIEVAPSLKVFDGVRLWSSAEAPAPQAGAPADPTGVLDVASGGSSEVGGGEGGGAMLDVIKPIATESPYVSLADLLLAIATAFLTYFAARNIPGLLEITLLQRLKLKPGGSYAVTTVVRYLIVLIGLITAFAYLDITWGKVQWIAAAITLGIGFGLQEVVANFVAGLILLFERPIRLGDYVTVGGVNGTVTQIRMRATTIRDRGNRELLVPNKEFITGQLVNWTLTDLVIRVEVPVGIAYGSDTALAKRLLREVGEAHESVLKDPPPVVVFSAFGASSLDFELRVFISGAADLVVVSSDLHFAVDKAFREAGIEIAFPQQDLHLRSVPDGLLPDPAGGAAGE